MKRINRYILKHLLVAMAIATLILVFAIWLTQSLRFIRVIVDDAAPLGVFLTLVALSLPDIMAMILPVAAVGAMIFVYSRLLADSEVVVLRAAGMGQMRLIRPALGLAFAFTAVIYGLNLYVVPVANQELRTLQLLADARYASAFLRDGQFNQIDDNVTIYFRERRRSGEMIGILIHDNRNPDRPGTVTARQGLLQDTGQGPRVVLFDGSRQEYDRATNSLSVLNFTQYSIDLRIIEPNLANRSLRPRERFVGDLLFPDVDPEAEPQWYRRLVYEGHERLAWPLMVPAVTLLALAAMLAGEFARRGQGWRILGAIAFCAATVFAYLWAGGRARDSLSFVPALYLVPVLAALAGLFLLHRRSNAWFPQGWAEAVAQLRPIRRRRRRGTAEAG